MYKAMERGGIQFVCNNDIGGFAAGQIGSGRLPCCNDRPYFHDGPNICLPPVFKVLSAVNNVISTFDNHYHIGFDPTAKVP